MDQSEGVRMVWEGDMTKRCKIGQSEVQVGSMRGFHTGDRCRPQSKFRAFPFFLMWMASMVLLFQYPVAVAWTFAPSQSRECWDFCACTAIPFLGSPIFTAYLCSVILFFTVLLVSPMYVNWQSWQGTS